MSDIDFDELDRAVASVLGGADTDKKPQGPSPAVAIADAPSAAIPNVVTPASSSIPEATPPVAPIQPVTVVAVSAQALHAQPVKPVQRGRFLDMVHPAGDMSARPTSAPALSPVPSATNQTFVSDVVASTPAPSPAPVTQAPVPVKKPDASEVLPSSAVPVKEEPAPEPKEKEEPADFFAASPDDTNPQKTPETPSSPFIPDAKVEKRPLGVWSDTSNAAESLTGGSLPIGAELHDRLVQVESEDNIIETAEPFVAPKADEPTKKAPVSKAIEVKAPTVTQPEVVASKKPDLPITPVVPITKSADTITPVKPVIKLPDTSPQVIEKVPKYGKGTLIWVTVAIAVMLIGFGVGALLFFNVLHQAV